VTYLDYGFTDMDEIIVVDIETTGLVLGTDEIIEVKLLKAAIDGPGDETSEIYQRRFRTDAAMNPEAQAVHGITLAELRDEPEFGDHAQDIRDFIGLLPVVSHNARFAKDFLSVAFERAGVETLTLNKSYCTLNRLREYTGFVHGEWFRRALGDAAAYLNVSTAGFHGKPQFEPLVLKFRMAQLWWKWDSQGIDLISAHAGDMAADITADIDDIETQADTHVAPEMASDNIDDDFDDEVWPQARQSEIVSRLPLSWLLTGLLISIAALALAILYFQ
jgi:hypothetical protein